MDGNGLEFGKNGAWIVIWEFTEDYLGKKRSWTESLFGIGKLEIA